MCLSCTSSFALFAVSTWLSAGANKDVSLYQYLTDVSNVDIAELIILARERERWHDINFCATACNLLSGASTGSLFTFIQRCLYVLNTLWLRISCVAYYVPLTDLEIFRKLLKIILLFCSKL